MPAPESLHLKLKQSYEEGEYQIEVRQRLFLTLKWWNIERHHFINIMNNWPVKLLAIQYNWNPELNKIQNKADIFISNKTILFQDRKD